MNSKKEPPDLSGLGNFVSKNPTGLEPRKINNLVIQERIPEGEGPFPVFLLLHGWTGDETSMGIFASRLPGNALLLAARGLYESPLGGYSWQARREGGWPAVEDFREAIQALTGILTARYFPQGDFSQLRLVGFSQGAALAYSFALLKAKPLRALAGLSGFVPEGAGSLVSEKPLEGLPVFVAHGTQDQLVPAARARQGVEILRQAGAVVSYCEHNAGHKLNAACFRGLEEFFRRQEG